MLENTAASSSALAAELRNVVHQAEQLLHAISEDSDAAVGALRDRVNDAVGTAKARLADLEGQASRTAQKASIAADVYVRENPWTSVAIGAGVGLILGAILGNMLTSSRTPTEEQ